MRSSSGMSSMLQRGVILTFAFASHASEISNNQATITAPPAAAPIMARNQIVDGPCGLFDRWIPAQAADTCQSFADRYGITVDQLEVMNPWIHSTCNALTAGDGYCVGAFESESKPPLSCSSLSDVQGCHCNNGNYYGLMPNPGSAGPCAYSTGDLPQTASPPEPRSTSTVRTPTVTATPTVVTKPTTDITSPAPTPPPTTTPTPVWNNVCTTTPSTCLDGTTGTDKIAYTTGCCNGCGKGGTCGLTGPAKGPMVYECTCDLKIPVRRAFDGLVANNTWVG